MALWLRIREILLTQNIAIGVMNFIFVNVQNWSAQFWSSGSSVIGNMSAKENANAIGNASGIESIVSGKGVSWNTESSASENTTAIVTGNALNVIKKLTNVVENSNTIAFYQKGAIEPLV